MRDDSPSKPHVVSSMSAMQSAICPTGGGSAMMRPNMRMGAKKGTIEVQNASCELGCCKTGVASMMAKMMGNMAGHCTCCASASEFTMEPSAAYMVEYRK